MKIMAVINLVALVAIIGFPRVPGFDVPISIFILPLYYRELLRGFRIGFIRKSLFIQVIFLFYGVMIWVICDDPALIDIKFLLTLFVKGVLTVFSALVVAKLLRSDINLLRNWIVLQSILITASIYSAVMFDFLVLFSGAAGYEVYSQIGGVRSIGFGLVHVYGACTMLFACLFYIANTRKSLFSGVALLVPMVLSFFIARTALIVAAVSVLVNSLRRFIFFMLLFSFVSYAYYSYGDFDNMLYQLFEVGVNYFSTGKIYTASTNANLEMIRFPENCYAWFVGYGKFFEDDHFFKHTDLGYSRLMLFGGLGFLIIFLAQNMYPIIKGVHLLKKMNSKDKLVYRNLLVIYGVSFFVVNAKGLIDIGLFAYVMTIFIQRAFSSVRMHG